MPVCRQITREVTENSKEVETAMQKGQQSKGIDAFLESIEARKRVS